MKEYAKNFYKSKSWQKVSRIYMASKNYICERCGGIGEICHHKKYITPKNINDLEVTLNFDNLECLCRDCHNKEHTLKHSRIIFDGDGNCIDVKESNEIEEYKKAVQSIEHLNLQERRL